MSLDRLTSPFYWSYIMGLWLYVAVCGIVCLIILFILGIMRFRDIIQSDFLPEFAMIVGVITLCVLAVFYSYKTVIWMKSNNCVKTHQHREVTHFVSVLSGSTTILVPQTSVEYLYTCDNGKTIWWN